MESAAEMNRHRIGSKGKHGEERSGSKAESDLFFGILPGLFSGLLKACGSSGLRFFCGIFCQLSMGCPWLSIIMESRASSTQTGLTE